MIVPHRSVTVNAVLAEQIPLVHRPKPLGLALETRLAELTA